MDQGTCSEDEEEVSVLEKKDEKFGAGIWTRKECWFIRW